MRTVERIDLFIKSEGISVRSFEQKISASNGLIRRAIANKTDIQGKWLSLIVDNYPQLNSEWLLTGRGSMLKSCGKKNVNNNIDVNYRLGENFGEDMGESHEKQTKTDQFTSLPIETNVPTIYNSNISPTAVPFYDLPVSAGELGVLIAGNESNKKADGFIDMPIFSGCEKVLPVIGISMEPIIFSGDFIGVKSIPDISSRWDFLQTGKIYLIVTREERMIKYISQANDNEYIVCTSPNYSPFKVHKSEVLQVFRVAAIARGL